MYSSKKLYWVMRKVVQKKGRFSLFEFRVSPFKKGH